MYFNSYVFILAFLPITVLGYYLINKTKKYQLGHMWLLGASLIFAGYLNVYYAVITTVSVLIGYLFILLVTKQSSARKNKKIYVTAGIVVHVGILLYFKYSNFFIENINEIFDKEIPFLELLLPLGISFYTFQQIAYLVDCYRDNSIKCGFWEYFLYIMYFPKFLQGPILLHEDMLPALHQEENKKFSWEHFSKGLYAFALGLGKKVLLADNIALIVDAGYNNIAELNAPSALLVIIGYSLQLYFDFSGYCDMAMGVSQMMGFSLPINFDSPYKANNILEFWKRWHMTLTRFFTKYLYIPLGGNRKGEVRTYLNMLIIFFVSGIWHGAGLTFILWGMLHGILYVVTKWLKSRRGDAKQAQQSDAKFFGTAGHVLSVACTFLYVNIAWIFFRASTLQEALSVLKKMFSFEFRKINLNFAKCFELDEFWYVMKVLKMDRFDWAHYVLMVLLLLVALAIVFFGKTAPKISEKIKPTVLSSCVLAVLLVWCILSFSNVSSFIYVNF